MIKVKHPDNECNVNQESFLNELHPDQRRTHELLFSVGNATFIYYSDVVTTENDFENWLEHLSGQERENLKGLKFEDCKKMVGLIKFINESKTSITLEQFIRESIGDDDYNDYIKLM